MNFILFAFLRIWDYYSIESTYIKYLRNTLLNIQVDKIMKGLT